MGEKIDNIAIQDLRICRVNMRLDKYLQEKGYAASRSRAVHQIKMGNVHVNGTACLKQSYDVKASDLIEVERHSEYVSRAGYKIESSFKKHGLNVRGLSVLDAGCSTGGFSDFFLQEGASRVVGLDIAADCVDEKLLLDQRFRFFGRVDVLSPESLKSCLGEERFDLISIDLSNALLRDALPRVDRFLKPGGMIAALFKPPYEIKKRIASSNGIEELTEEFDLWLKGKYKIVHKDVSPIKGGSKNRGTVELIYILCL